MVTWLAERISNELIRANIIDTSEKDLYVYGFFLLISKLSFLVLSIMAGFTLKITAEAVVFYVSFIIIREYAGGVHAKTEMVCMITTSLVIVLSIMLIKLMILWCAQVLPLAMLFVGYVLIYAFSPLESNKKPLNSTERIKYRKIILQIITLYAFVVATGWCVGYKRIAYSVICAVFLEGVLLLVGKKSASCKN